MVDHVWCCSFSCCYSVCGHVTAESQPSSFLDIPDFPLEWYAVRLPAIYRVQQLIFTLEIVVGPLVVISAPTTMVQSMIHSICTTVHDRRNVVANEVDLFLIYCLVICLVVSCLQGSSRDDSYTYITHVGHG